MGRLRIPPLNIVHVTPELSPFSESGGLGMAVSGMTSAMAALGLQVSVVTPAYASVRRDLYRPVGEAFTLTLGRRVCRVTLHEGRLKNGVRVILVDCPEAYDRPGLYGPRKGIDYPDNAWRYAVLSEAAMQAARRLRLHPDIIHCHDWQTGLLPYVVRERYRRWFRTVMTVHNVGYHGNFPADTIEELGLDRQLFHPDRAEFWGWLSFLKAGLVYADQLTTVSPTHAAEICTEAYGHGLHGLFEQRREALVGILNGVDYDLLPEAPTDRRDLCDKHGLVAEETPIVGVVSRLDRQKGVDLLEDALTPLLRQGRLRVAILGDGDAALEASLGAFAERWPGRVGVTIGYDRDHARLILSGSDGLLMPSRYEPCGLAQLHALRYGTLPIVRNTGGLTDTVEPGVTGFVFQEPTASALRGAIQELLDTAACREAFLAMTAAARARDFSWTRAATAYAELYEEVRHAE